MATATDFAPLAGAVVKGLGGPDNIRSFTHCATRLRFKVKDASLVDSAAVEGTEGVLALMAAGGQQQVVIGNDVPFAYAAVQDVAGMRAKGTKDSEDSDETDAADDDTSGESKNLFNRFIDLISALFTPIVMVLAGIAIGKAFLQMGLQFGWLAENSGTAVVFNATFDGVFYFLPLFLAVTAAKRFRMNTFVALAVVTPLVHPGIVELAATEGATAFGLSFPSMSYSSSVIPAIVAVWVASYVEHWFNKILPGAVRSFLTPLLVVVVMVPLTLFTIGPATTWISTQIASGVTSLYNAVPWLAGAILGGFWQVFVMFGLHWGFVPVFINDLGVNGYEPLLAPILAAVMAQAAATAAVAIWSRSAARKKVAGPAAFSGIVAGVTEPAIYGVNLPLKMPFYMGIAGGIVGGLIAGLSDTAANSFIFPALLALPAYTEVGNFVLLLIGTAVAMVIAFVGTAVTLRRAEAEVEVPAGAHPEIDDAALAPVAAEGDAGRATPVSVPTAQATDHPVVVAPVSGTVVPLEQDDDKVFASGSMGAGTAIEPSDGRIVAPVSGELIAVQKSGHAYGLRSDDGVEVLVHVGIDTVMMKGEGFTVDVTRGQHVAAGEQLGTVDLAEVAANNHPATTIVVVTNSRKLGAVIPTATGEVAAGAAVLDVEK
ncbi:beta-glucoside-specific PTS transporter subunit IIABC [Corynebacterium frankenforstense]|uniref:beta-glucoside-specific PTS transporter subunit IIABC n=1 Tax=Corynebacterium frankenforstense TaxID=1230998 RepID=UPI00254F5D1D|nr:beta-glucoside-specific PTS transporter subunit IIABC [Corynebacterium frankenforstense]MDK6260652.1 beta-glucoside-specific PTS transporter subunit IIABC [Corynebacterium frankenforstense]